MSQALLQSLPCGWRAFGLSLLFSHAFCFVSGKTFVPAFQRGGRESRRVAIQASRAGWCYVYLGGGSTYSCVSVSDCVKFCVLRVSILGLFSAACSPISWATDLTSLWLASDVMACFFFLCRSWDGWCQSISGVFCRSISDRHQVCFLDLEDFLCCTRVRFLVDVFL